MAVDSEKLNEGPQNPSVPEKRTLNEGLYLFNTLQQAIFKTAQQNKATTIFCY